jgi:hypothetical protein
MAADVEGQRNGTGNKGGVGRFGISFWLKKGAVMAGEGAGM